jgi:cell wall-associated NlpC family hydrolase
MILIGLAAVGMLTIVNAKDNADTTETIDFESIVNGSDDDNNKNDENTGLSDIDTQQLGIYGAGVYSLDEIEVPTEASINDTSDETSTENDDEDVNEYADLAIANVTNYVNVRSNPDTDSAIVGKIYNGAVAQVLSTAGDNDDWFQVVSGNVEGYIKSEFFIYGDDAAAVIDNYVTRYAVVIADRLNVREEPDKESKRIGYIDNGEQVKFIEDLGEWYKVEYTDGKLGYVASEYVTIKEEFVYAKTIEEEQTEIAATKVLEERETVSEETVSENVTITVTPPSANYSSSSELRNSIVDYAMQFLGNKYVHGGQSLVTGTDCSGFTSLIYSQFGYSISRTPSGQLSSNGRSISLSEAQPGDIICYGSSGKCTHVALYIGNGQIIHSANSKKGVIISSATYDTILGVKNVID